MALIEKKNNLRRLEAQRNEMNTLVPCLEHKIVTSSEKQKLQHTCQNEGLGKVPRLQRVKTSKLMTFTTVSSVLEEDSPGLLTKSLGGSHNGAELHPKAPKMSPRRSLEKVWETDSKMEMQVMRARKLIPPVVPLKNYHNG